MLASIQNNQTVKVINGGSTNTFPYRPIFRGRRRVIVWWVLLALAAGSI